MNFSSWFEYKNTKVLPYFNETVFHRTARQDVTRFSARVCQTAVSAFAHYVSFAAIGSSSDPLEAEMQGGLVEPRRRPSHGQTRLSLTPLWAEAEQAGGQAATFSALLVRKGCMRGWSCASQPSLSALPGPLLRCLFFLALHSRCNDFYTELAGCCLDGGSQSAMPLRPYGDAG